MRNFKPGAKRSPTNGRRGFNKARPRGVEPITKYFTRSRDSKSSLTIPTSPPIEEEPALPSKDTGCASHGVCNSREGRPLSSQPLPLSSKEIQQLNVCAQLSKPALNIKKNDMDSSGGREEKDMDSSGGREEKDMDSSGGEKDMDSSGRREDMNSSEGGEEKDMDSSGGREKDMDSSGGREEKDMNSSEGGEEKDMGSSGGREEKDMDSSGRREKDMNSSEGGEEKDMDSSGGREKDMDSSGGREEKDMNSSGGGEEKDMDSRGENLGDTSQDNVIVIGDSPPTADSVTTVDLTVPTPKRPCLIDLTESPVVNQSQVTEPEVSESTNDDSSSSLNQVPVTTTAAESTAAGPATKKALFTESMHSAPCSSPDCSISDATTKLQSSSGDKVSAVDLLCAKSELPVATERANVKAHSVEKIQPVLDEHHRALLDLELVLCQRGASYFKGESPAVKLFSTTQESVIDNLLDFNSRVPAQKLASIVQYLNVAMTAVNMPKAPTLHKLWELITDPITSSCADNFPVLHDIHLWLHRLLLVHPPGQCRTVDQQYVLFIASLSTPGAAFGLWEHIADLISGTECCIHFFSILVDLLLADYWACLNSQRAAAPLFVGLFWQNALQTHITVSIRKLLEVVTLLLMDFSGSEIESIKLSNLLVLVYLVYTRCSDIITELLLVAQKLPVDKLLLFLARVQPLSLSKRLVENVPQLKEFIAKPATICLHTSGSAAQKGSMDSITSDSTGATRDELLATVSCTSRTALAIKTVAPLNTSVRLGHSKEEGESTGIARGKKRLVAHATSALCKAKRRGTVAANRALNKCENCIDGTCLHCVQGYSAFVN